MLIYIFGVRTQCTLGAHDASVEAVRWGGSGKIYTASRDRMIYVWDITSGNAKLIRQLKGHAHRINAIALSCDYVCRTGPFDEKGYRKFASPIAAKEAATKRYAAASKLEGASGERLVSASDDFTMFVTSFLKNKY